MIVLRAIGVCLACATLAGGAMAADLSGMMSPQLAPDLVAPSTSGFDGFYAGILFGPISSRKDNFAVGGQPVRPEFGGVVGYNHAVYDNLVVGGELQATVATDVVSSTYYRLTALARLGFAAGDNTLIYALGGVSRMGGAWALEGGVGTEIMVSDRVAARLEAAAIHQVGEGEGGVDIPYVSALRITGGAIVQLDGPPARTGFNTDGVVTDFSGAYAGINLGSLADPRFSFFDNYGYGWHLSRFELGTLAGYNFAVGDRLRVGAEAQVGVNFDTSGDAGLDVLALGHLGIVPFDGWLAYAAAGAGMVENESAYAAGGGVEYALWGNASLRAEALVVGRLDGFGGKAPDRVVTTKATLGAVWHFD